MVTIRGEVWPAGNSFDPTIEAESYGPSDENRSPAAAGHARRRAARSAATTHPTAAREILLVDMRTLSDDACGDTKVVRNDKTRIFVLLGTDKSSYCPQAPLAPDAPTGTTDFIAARFDSGVCIMAVSSLS